ncbi:NDP-sugar synthase [Streptomyces sp. M10(2022)]
MKNAEEALKDDTFLVISGDALTDFDLTELIAFHKEKGALVTVCLTRVPNPLEFGITIVDEEGQVERFLEKPTWGQVFSDTVNTGIYVMEPEVFDYVQADTSVDWSGDVFPQLMKDGKPIYGYIAEGYWEDVGTHESYVKAQADVLERKVDVELDGFEISRACGSPRVLMCIPTPFSAGRCTSVTTPRSKRAPRFVSTRSSDRMSSSRPVHFCTGPSCTTTCTSASTATCVAV